MSTVTVQTISNGTVSTSSANVIQGSAKAWVNFNGVGGASIRASFNVSSVTRNSTGNYSVNLTNAMPDANYAVTAGLNKNDPGADGFGGFTTGTTTLLQTASVARIITSQGNTYPSDSPQISVVIFR
jgi:hypothetical protein